MNEQKLQKETIDILAMLTLNYWCNSEEEKAELTSMYSDNELKYQEELREKYNPDNIFKKEEPKREPEVQNNVAVIEYKETIFDKLLNKIKQFFNMK